MKLRNKITGAIHDIDELPLGLYNSLAEIMGEWEDYEEPKRHWFISGTRVYEENGYSDEGIASLESVGNHFKTKEEAERAVEKLKAWKRLRDKGFRFEGIKEDYTRILQQNPFRTGKRYLQFNKSEDEDWMKENWNDLDLLFGGEE